MYNIIKISLYSLYFGVIKHCEKYFYIQLYNNVLCTN